MELCTGAHRLACASLAVDAVDGGLIVSRRGESLTAIALWSFGYGQRVLDLPSTRPRSSYRSARSIRGMFLQDPRCCSRGTFRRSLASRGFPVAIEWGGSGLARSVALLSSATISLCRFQLSMKLVRRTL